MKQLFTIALLGLINLGSFAQGNSVLLIHETFNTEVNLETGYSVSPTNSMVLDSSPNTYNNSPCLRSNSGLGYVTLNPVNLLSNTDSVHFSFHGQKYSYTGTIEVQISTDSIEWEALRVFNITSSSWVQYQHTQTNWIQNSDDSLYIRLKVDPTGSGTNNTALYVDDFIVTSYHSEPIPPPICDTLYVEVPIFVTDSIPQSCMLDNNGDGIIGTQDLLGLLIYYGTYSNCIVQ